jgi:outer membrane protein, heavy metal efflux system
MGRSITRRSLAAFLLATLVSQARAEDLRLGDLVREAFEHSPDILAAEAQARASEQTVCQEGSLPDPMLSTGYQNGGLNGYTFGESSDSWWMFSLSQTLPFPGKRSLQREAASYEAASARAAADAVKREVASRVAQAYYDLLLATRELDLIQARGPLASRIEEAALARYAAGTGNQEEVIMAQSSKYMLMEAQAMAMSGRSPPRPCSGARRGGPPRRPSAGPPTLPPPPSPTPSSSS